MTAAGQTVTSSLPNGLEGNSLDATSLEVEHSPDHLVIHLRGVGRTLLKTVRMFVEAMMIPGTIFAIVLTTNGDLLTAVLCALGWYYTVIAVRWFLHGTVPGTLALCATMFHGRAAIALLFSSAAIYLLQPIAMSLLMATIFLGSALLGRPLTERLARDFVHVPEHILARAGVRRMFSQVAMVWAVSRVVDAAVTTFFYTESTNAGMISRSTFTPALTITTIAGCVWFGMRALRKDGITFQHLPMHLPHPHLPHLPHLPHPHLPHKSAKG